MAGLVHRFLRVQSSPEDPVIRDRTLTSPAHTQKYRACAEGNHLSTRHIYIHYKCKSDVCWVLAEIGKKNCWFGHEAHIWCRAFLQNKTRITSNIPHTPCPVSAQQTEEKSFCVFKPNHYIYFRCTPDETMEIKKKKKKSKQSSVLQIVAVNMWPYCPGPLLSVYSFHMSAQQAKPHISLGWYPQRGEAGERIMDESQHSSSQPSSLHVW